LRERRGTPKIGFGRPGSLVTAVEQENDRSDKQKYAARAQENGAGAGNISSARQADREFNQKPVFMRPELRPGFPRPERFGVFFPVLLKKIH
jgi:hypothetical protein